jgi:ATP-dependent DNA helicase RecQ
VYGLLKIYPVKRVIAMLHRLIEAGLAKQRDADGTRFMPVVELTASGAAVMVGKSPVPVTLADLAGHRPSGSRQRVTVAVDVTLDAEALRRFERLRAARAELARQRQLPAYCICHDSTLKQIAQAAPRNLQSLGMIKGMGMKKVDAYGQALLEAIAPQQSYDGSSAQ